MIDQPNDNYHLRNSGYTNYFNNVEMARHRWYYYKEGFSPNLVKQAIDETGIEGDDLIVDIFNGSGTTTLTAALNGHKSHGIEVNPFTAFLSETKSKNVSVKEIDSWKPSLIGSIHKGDYSNLINFSTFSKGEKNEKWLFNDSVLKAFEGGWKIADAIPSYNLKRIFKLALISAAMKNCNARKDGKCLRYMKGWDKKELNKETFIKSLNAKIEEIKADVESNPLKISSTIENGDARRILKSKNTFERFKLCVTSPPYLNTFDYTDIYRPELFLGKFVNSPVELYNLRLKTVRSHIQAQWKTPEATDFGKLYENCIKHLKQNPDKLMHKRIPMMIQAYFEDMRDILVKLRAKAAEGAQVWLVVSNSAYANEEIPVDLIIADIGSRVGWDLREVGVMRKINKRKTVHSPDVTELRESVVIFSPNKK